MASRAARLLQLLDTLRRRRTPAPGALLARELGVTLRTLYRDVATLREQGAAIAGEPGVGYVLQPGFLLPPLMFSADELEALLLGARWVSLQADPELAQAADGALARIASTLPADARLGLETSGLMVPQSGTPAPPEPWLPALRRAIRDERKVVLQYRDADGQATRRTVWPFAMGFFQQSRMLAAWCELHQDFRHFRADRVLHLHPTDAPLPERRHALIRRWKAQLHTHPTADRN